MKRESCRQRHSCPTPVALAIVLASLSCGGGPAKSGGGGAGGGGGGGAGAAGHDAATDAGACPAVTRPDPCPQGNTWCITDVRAERTKFATCLAHSFPAPPYLTACGRYDAIVHAGIDSWTTYYFDRTDGHLVGVTNSGVTTLMPCGAYDPSFNPSECDITPLLCPTDGGATTASSEPRRSSST